MRTLFFLLIPFITQAQTRLMTLQGHEYAVIRVDSAARLAYWGDIGIKSVPLLKYQDMDIGNLNAQLTLSKAVNANCVSAAEEYRNRIQTLAVERANLNSDMNDMIKDRDKWRDRARNRGNTIAILGAVLGVVIYVGIQ